MKHKYVYVFPLGFQLQWSYETKHTLPRRAGTEEDKIEIADFIKTNSIGSFIKLTTGEMIFQID